MCQTLGETKLYIYGHYLVLLLNFGVLALLTVALLLMKKMKIKRGAAYLGVMAASVLLYQIPVVSVQGLPYGEYPHS